MKVYVDMDGVLVDFFTPFANKYGYKNHKDMDPTHVVRYLDDLQSDPKFWHELPRLSRAYDLLNVVIENFGNFSILSQPWDNDPNCAEGKLDWLNKNLIDVGYYPEDIIFTKHKQTLAFSCQHLVPNVLIDDFGPNVKKWTNAGGIGVKHKNHKFERTLRNLLKLV
jgi:hypothetical protein